MFFVCGREFAGGLRNIEKKFKDEQREYEISTNNREWGLIDDEEGQRLKSRGLDNTMETESGV